MLIGFAAIFLAACAGTFLAFDATEAFIHDKSILSSWTFTLLSSAHAHTNLFGMIHILFGLTLPYAQISKKIQILQTYGLSAGTFAMSVLMFIRAFEQPFLGYDILGICMGISLSAFLLSLGVHCYSLARKIMR